MFKLKQERSKSFQGKFRHWHLNNYFLQSTVYSGKLNLLNRIRKGLAIDIRDVFSYRKVIFCTNIRLLVRREVRWTHNFELWTLFYLLIWMKWACLIVWFYITLMMGLVFGGFYFAPSIFKEGLIIHVFQYTFSWYRNELVCIFINKSKKDVEKMWKTNLRQDCVMWLHVFPCSRVNPGRWVFKAWYLRQR